MTKRSKPFTDAPVGADTLTPAAPPKPKLITPFFAIIRVLSTVRWVGEGAELLLNGVPTRFPLAPARAQQLREHPIEPEQVYSLTLWFRTLGGQVQDLMLAGIKLPKERLPAEALDFSPTCTLAGRLNAVFPEEGSFDVRVETNLAGQLQQPFDVRVWAVSDFLARLPRTGKTLIVYGKYQPETGHLTAQSLRKTHVGQPEPKPDQPKDVLSGP